MDEKPHLSHIEVYGYKSIKELNLKMSPINILIGANGAGKSNFISLFTLLSELSQGKFQDYVIKDGGANNIFHFGIKNTKGITLDLDVGNNSYHVDFLYKPNEDSLYFSNEYCKFSGSSKIWEIKGKNGESGLFGGEAASKNVRNYTREYLEKCRVYHFHDTSKTANFKQTTSLDASDYLYRDAGNIAAFLYRLRNEFEKDYREIVDAISAAAPFFHDFYLEPRGEEGKQSVLLKWLHKNYDEPFSAQQLSDGTARFICMATLFLQPLELRPNTIILDEPELGLHPAALDILADMVKSTAKDSQVICSTQSVTFANSFGPKDFIVVDQKTGVSSFKRPDIKELEFWLQDYGMGDIWNKNLIGGRPEW